MTTTPAAPRRRITNRRMFVIMLGRALARRRSRALAAIGSSAVGAATLFCLAAVCLAIPAQMNAQMRQFGANLILVPLQGSSEAATAGPAATPSAASAAPHPSGVATPSGSAAATPSGGSAAASATATPTAAAATAAPHPSAAASPSPGADAAAPATARVSPQAAADAADAVAAATGSSPTRPAAYRHETVRHNKPPYPAGGSDPSLIHI